jgi:DNA-binding NarL/FixJ family response regulator
LRALLDATGRFTVVGEATDDVVRLISEHKPDILLLDWDMSQRDGMSIFSELAASGLSVHTILLSVRPNADVAAAIQLGAKGILSHETTAESLCEGIRKVMDGQYVLGTAGISSLVGSLRNPRPRTAFETAQRKFGLTRREFEIMTWVVAGYSNIEIAEKFSLSIHTVKHHISHIFDKTGVSNRVELGLFAVNHRITGNTP